MTIDEYVKKKKITTQEFANIVGVSFSIARLWIHRASSPRLFHAMKINKITKGKVKLSEMLSYTDEKELSKAV